MFKQGQTVVATATTQGMEAGTAYAIAWVSEAEYTLVKAFGASTAFRVSKVALLTSTCVAGS